MLDPLVKADLLSAALERVGFAMWQVQALEETVANYLVIRVRGHKGMGSQKGHALLDEALKMTFGQQVSDLKNANVLNENLANRLKAAVAERNWFAHHSRREMRGLFAKPELYESLMARSEKFAEEARVLNNIVARELVMFVRASGVDEAEWERKAHALAKEWGLLD